MTTETRRRQMREMLMAKANRIIEADRMRTRETIKRIHESRRNLKRPYSPEAGVAMFRDFFGDRRRKATIGE